MLISYDEIQKCSTAFSRPGAVNSRDVSAVTKISDESALDIKIHHCR